MNSPSDDRVERLKGKLYSPGAPDVMNKTIRPLQEKNYKVDSVWKKEEQAIGDPSLEAYMNLEEKPKVSKFAWIFVALAFVFFAVSAGFAYYFITEKQGVVNNVSIYATGPVSIDGGNIASLDVTIENRNTFPLELVDLVVVYPPGSKNPKNGIEDLDRTREGLGSINPGESITRNIEVILFGSEKEVKSITLRAEYGIPNSNASYDNEKQVDITLLNSPVEFGLTLDKEVIPNQEVELMLRVRSNSVSDVRGMVIEAEYPLGFVYKESIPAPVEGNNIWRIDEFKSLATSTIVIKGTFTGETDAERFFRFKAGVGDRSQPNKVKSLFATSLEKVKLAEEFLGTTLTIDDSAGNTNLVTSMARGLSARIDWKNNLPLPLTDLQIEATIRGDSLDKKSVNTGSGFYRSRDEKIVWNSSTLEDFSSVDPGEFGTLNFGFATLPFDPEAPVKNQSITIDISVSGKRPSERNVPETIQSSVIKTIKIKTDPGMASRAVYYVGPFQNSGPLPPKVDEKTTYTVVWTLTNTTNDISNTQVEGYLPPHARFTGKISPENERITFDERSGKITWNAGLLPAGTGYSRPTREVAFQVEVIPSANQVGQTLFLVDRQKISGMDTFTNTLVESFLDEAASTRISTDPNYNTDIDRVTE